MCGKIVARWLNSTLATAFVTWVDHSRAQKRMVVLCSRLLSKLMNNLDMAFMTWRDNSRMKRRADRIIGGVLAQWTHQTASAAFKGWFDHAKRQARMESICARVLFKLMNRSLDLGFCTWKDHAEKLKRAKSIITKIVNRMKNISLVSALCTWKQLRITSRKEVTAIRRVLLRWTHLRLSQAFQLLLYYGKEKCRIQMEAVMMLWNQKYRANIRVYFQNWHENTLVSKNVKRNRSKTFEEDRSLNQMLDSKRPLLLRSRSWHGPIVDGSKGLMRLLEIRWLQLGQFLKIVLVICTTYRLSCLTLCVPTCICELLH